METNYGEDMWVREGTTFFIGAGNNKEKTRRQR